MSPMCHRPNGCFYVELNSIQFSFAQIAHIHLSMLLTPCAVFSRDTLLQPRWFLDEKPKNTEGIWSEVLVVNSAKQHIFMQRVLFIFEIKQRSAGKAQVLRLQKQEWATECDLACMAGYVLECMQRYRNADNQLTFTPASISTMMTRFIEGYLSVNSNVLYEGRSEFNQKMSTNLLILGPL